MSIGALRASPRLSRLDMPRAIWKGSISFGLVQIPVGLHSAEQRDELKLTLLDKHDMAPVGYRRYNKTTGEEVEWKDIVKGYAVDDEKYVILTPEDLQHANPEATQTIDIVAFVDRHAIEELYFDKPYYLAPEKAGRKAYAVLRETLRRTERVGVAKVVIRTRQHLAAVVPSGPALVLELLRFADELKQPKGLDLPAGELKKLGISSREIQMAEQLVEGLSEAWDPSQYRDDYRKDLLALVEQKAERGDVNVIASPGKLPKRKGAQVIDLMALLKKSVEEQGGARAKPPRKAKAKTKTSGAQKARRKTGSRTRKSA